MNNAQRKPSPVGEGGPLAVDEELPRGVEAPPPTESNK